MMTDASAPRPVRLPTGFVYVVSAVVDGELRDPWVFTQSIDAQVKLEEIRLAGMSDRTVTVQAAVYRVRVVDAGVEPENPFG